MKFTLYSRAECHLCDVMHAALEAHVPHFPFEIERVDVDRDPDLRHRYGARVPVLVFEGEEICHYFLDEPALLARLSGGGAAPPDLCRASPYERIYALVAQIPAGRVATYGQLARMAGRCTPRMVGYAMAALPGGRGLPWHRVINSQGRCAPRRDGGGAVEQEDLLRAEGLPFDRRGRVDLARVVWEGPDWDWAERHGFHPVAPPARS